LLLTAVQGPASGRALEVGTGISCKQPHACCPLLASDPDPDFPPRQARRPEQPRIAAKSPAPFVIFVIFESS